MKRFATLFLVLTICIQCSTMVIFATDNTHLIDFSIPYDDYHTFYTSEVTIELDIEGDYDYIRYDLSPGTDNYVRTSSSTLVFNLDDDFYTLRVKVYDRDGVYEFESLKFYVEIYDQPVLDFVEPEDLGTVYSNDVFIDYTISGELDRFEYKLFDLNNHRLYHDYLNGSNTEVSYFLENGHYEFTVRYYDTKGNVYSDSISFEVSGIPIYEPVEISFNSPVDGDTVQLGTMSIDIEMSGDWRSYTVRTEGTYGYGTSSESFTGSWDAEATFCSTGWNELIIEAIGLDDEIYTESIMVFVEASEPDPEPIPDDEEQLITEIDILSPDEYNMQPGETQQILIRTYPQVSKESVNFKSSRSTYVQVDDNGTITAIKPGWAIISIYTDSGLEESIFVEVKINNQTRFDITDDGFSWRNGIDQVNGREGTCAGNAVVALALYNDVLPAEAYNHETGLHYFTHADTMSVLRESPFSYSVEDMYEERHNDLREMLTFWNVVFDLTSSEQYKSRLNTSIDSKENYLAISDIEIINSELDNREPVIMTYQYLSSDETIWLGHAVIIIGYSYNPQNGSYYYNIYDSNWPASDRYIEIFRTTGDQYGYYIDGSTPCCSDLNTYLNNGNDAASYRPSRISITTSDNLEELILDQEPINEEEESENDDSQVVMWLGTPEIAVNGEMHNLIAGELSVVPIIVDQRTMIPIRGLFEALDGRVGWSEREKKITIYYNDCFMELFIGSNIAKFNGLEVEMDVEPFVQNNRSYLPIRFIGEAFGFKVDWRPEDNAIYLTR